jgi:hypothetical protein
VLLCRPIIAPIIGGVLCQSFGWRSTFVLLCILAFPATLLSYLYVPETHHYFVHLHHQQKNKELTKLITTENHENPGQKEEVEVEVDERDNQIQLITTTETSGDLEMNQPSTSSALDPQNNESIHVDKNNDVADTPVTTSEEISKKKYDKNISLELYEKLHIHKKKVIIELEDLDTTEIPPLIMPWEVLAFLFDPELAPVYFATAITFSM